MYERSDYMHVILVVRRHQVKKNTSFSTKTWLNVSLVVTYIYIMCNGMDKNNYRNLKIYNV